MIFSGKTRNILFIVFTILAALAAVYHFIGIFYTIDQSPFWRHIIFVGINSFCIYGLIKRPKYFIIVVMLLLVQQYYSHGTYLLKMWNEKKEIHWISMLDLILLPILLICLWDESNAKRAKNIT